MDNRQLSTWVKELKGDGGRATATIPQDRPSTPLPPKVLPPFGSSAPTHQPPYNHAPPRVRPEVGKPSIKYGHLGVWILCKGPYANDMPGDRFNVVILDREGKVRRRLLQVPRFKVAEAAEGDPDVLVDVDEMGHMDKILNEDFEALCFDTQRFMSLIGQWSHAHGRREYAF